MKIAKTRAVKTPTRGTGGSAGLDFYIPDDMPWQELFVYPNDAINIPSGIIAEIPHGYALVAMNKSGIALNHNLQVGACVIDEDYQGEIHLHLFNIGKETVKLMPGQKIEQFICLPVNYVTIEEVPAHEIHKVETERGTGGFGSTNKKDVWPVDYLAKVKCICNTSSERLACCADCDKATIDLDT